MGRKLVLKAAHALGLNIRRNNLETRSDWRLERFLEHHGVRTVLDVGANRGQFARELLDAGYRGRIISFEALPDVHEALTSTARQWGSGWTVAPRCALSNESGKAVFHVADNLASSSLLAPCDALSREGVGFDKAPTIEVPCERLDDVLRVLVEAEGPLFLKLDVQGAEMKVLEGAKATMARVVGLQLEMSLSALYEGQPLAREMDRLMMDQGFELWDMEPAFRDRNLGKLLQIDGVYFRGGPAEPASAREGSIQ